MITATNEDNLLMMSRYQDKHFDLAIVDPEYGIGEAGKNHKSRNTLVRQSGGQMRRCPSSQYTRKDWDNKPAGREYFIELKRVSVEQVIFGANYFEFIMPVCKPPRRNEFAQFLIDHPFGFIIWDKVNGNSDFSDCEVIYTSFNFKSFVIPYMWAGMMQGVSIARGTVMQGNKRLNEKRIHPTQKPVMLYKWLLIQCIQKWIMISQKAIKVLDTNRGSGSLDIACYDLGIDLTTCESDAEYFDLANKRLEQNTRQQSLFKNVI